MALTDIAIRNAKVGKTAVKLFDGGGLYLFVSAAGGKLWRMKYRYLGKEKLLSLGAYPAVGLKEAREKREAAKILLAKGGDPGVEKKKAAVIAALSAETTFSAVANELIEKRGTEGLKDITTTKAKWLLSLLETGIGSRPLADIEAFELLDVLKKIEISGRKETARRCLSFAGRVFRYGVATTRCKRDVAADLRGALIAPKVKHHAALLEPEAVGALLRAIDSFDGQPSTIWALQIAPHVFVRPGELRQAEWSEIDLEAAVWRIPAARMKMKREHAVPLSEQVVAILKEVKSLTGSGRFVFPSIRTTKRPMSENTLNAALRRMGYTTDEMTSHGFRSTASTLLNESGKWSSDAIERALAHGNTDGVRSIYHRGAHWAERVQMAQWWSDYLDRLKEQKTVVPFQRHASSGGG
jgi:integrase